MTIGELGRTVKAIERFSNSPAVRGLDVIRATERLGQMISPIVAAQAFGQVTKVIKGLQTVATVLAE